MPGVHLIVTIATIAEKSVSDQMDTSLLTIPAIVTIAIAGIGSGSIPAIAAIIWTQASDQNDRHISQGALQYWFILC